jgi:MFS family permease
MTTSRLELQSGSGRVTPDSESSPPAGQRLGRAMFLVQLFAVGIGYLIYTMNRTAFPIGLHNIASSLSFSVVQVGTLATIFLIGQGIIDIPAGFWNASRGKTGLTHRMNVLMLIGTAGAGVMSLFLAYLAFNYPLTLTYRILFGVFEGIFNISAYSFAGSVLPERRAFLNMCLGFFYATGAVIGPTVFSQIIASSPAEDSWRLGLSIFGIITIALGVAIFVVMAFTLRKAQRMSPIGSKMAASEPDERESTMAVLRDVLGRRAMWKGLAIHAVNLFAMWDFIGLMPTFLIQYEHKSVSFVGTVFGFGFGITSLVSPLFGLIADRYGRQIVVVSLGLIDAIALYLMLYYPLGSVATMVTVFIVGVSVNTIYFMGYTLAQDGVPNHRVPIATGLAGALGYVVAGCSGPVSGWLTGIADYRVAGLAVLVAPQLLAVVLALVFLPGIKTWQRLRREGRAIA